MNKITMAKYAAASLTLFSAVGGIVGISKMESQSARQPASWLFGSPKNAESKFTKEELNDPTMKDRIAELHAINAELNKLGGHHSLVLADYSDKQVLDYVNAKLYKDLATIFERAKELMSSVLLDLGEGRLDRKKVEKILKAMNEVASKDRPMNYLVNVAPDILINIGGGRQYSAIAGRVLEPVQVAEFSFDAWNDLSVIELIGIEFIRTFAAEIKSTEKVDTLKGLSDRLQAVPVMQAIRERVLVNPADSAK